MTHERELHERRDGPTHPRHCEQRRIRCFIRNRIRARGAREHVGSAAVRDRVREVPRAQLVRRPGNDEPSPICRCDRGRHRPDHAGARHPWRRRPPIRKSVETSTDVEERISSCARSATSPAHASCETAVQRDEKAHGPRHRPFPNANNRNVQENAEADRPRETTGNPCKWPRFKHDDCTTENRGVPGSSPGLAIKETSCKTGFLQQPSPNPSAVRPRCRRRPRASRVDDVQPALLGGSEMPGPWRRCALSATSRRARPEGPRRRAAADSLR